MKNIPQNKSIEIIKKNNLKVTPQRIAILEIIESYGHITIESLYQELSLKHTSLSLATVYKNILMMVEIGMLLEVPVLGIKSKYELKKENHIHLICTSCGNIEDKPLEPSIENIFSDLAHQKDFKLQYEQIILYGLCMFCQAK